MKIHNIISLEKKILGLSLIILVIVVAGLGTIIFIKQVKNIDYHSGDNNQITVSGIGQEYVKPDLALTNFSVKTEGATVKGVIQENSQNMNDVIQAVMNLGIAQKDIQTTNFNLYPRYEWTDEDKIFPSGHRVLVGYEMTQTLKVKIKDLETIGGIIEAATQAGANQVGDLVFTIENSEAVKRQARLQAISQAQEEAESLAKQLGVRLGKVMSVNFGTEMPQPIRMMAAGLGKGAESAVSVPQIETGENLIKVTANLTYRIN